MDFESFRGILATIGLVLFVGVFVLLLAWVYRPGGKKQMEKNAQIPLNDD